MCRVQRNAHLEPAVNFAAGMSGKSKHKLQTLHQWLQYLSSFIYSAGINRLKLKRNIIEGLYSTNMKLARSVMCYML